MADLYEKRVELRELSPLKIPDVEKAKSVADNGLQTASSIEYFVNGYYNCTYQDDGYEDVSGNTPNEKFTEIWEALHDTCAELYSEDVYNYFDSVPDWLRSAKNRLVKEKISEAESKIEQIERNPENGYTVTQEVTGPYSSGEQRNPNYSTEQVKQIDNLRKDIKTLKDLL